MGDRHPTFDYDGYPTEETLRTIRTWPIDDRALSALMAYIREAWTYPEYWRRRGRTHRIATGGWSGNESLIEALRSNVMAWALLWQESRRGGHYVLRLPEAARAAKEG